MYLDHETNSIYFSFQDLGYPKFYLDNILKEVRSKFYRTPLTSEVINQPRRPTISLPFNNFTNNFAKSVLKANKCDVAFAAKNTLKTTLINSTKTSGISDNIESGCYTIDCGDCELKYIGQTGRDLKVRVREHRENVNHGRLNSALFQHVAKTGHCINFNSSQIVYKSKDLGNRLTVESALIKSVPNFNNTHGACSVDQLSSNLILNSKRTLKNFVPD